MPEFITGMFYTRPHAEQAVQKLEELGYKRDEISVMMHDRTLAKDFAEHTGTSAGDASRVTDAANAAVKISGALAAIIAGAAAVNMLRQGSDGEVTHLAQDGGSRQDSGPPFVVGPLAAVLLPGLGAGILTALSKAGIPREHAEHYEQSLNWGGILIGVAAHPGDEQRVQEVMLDDGSSFKTS